MHAGQGFEEVNGTSAVPNSDLPSWVVTEAQAAQQHRGQAVNVNDRFTIPVSGAVSGANPLTSGQQTGARVISVLLRFAATGRLYCSSDVMLGADSDHQSQASDQPWWLELM